MRIWRRHFVAALKRLRVAFLVRRFGIKCDGIESLSIGRNTFFFARDVQQIGRNVYIGRNGTIENDCVISDAVIMGNNVALIGRHDHDYREVGKPIRLATSVRDPGFNVPLEQRLIHVERDVWIGYGSIILSGVRIGEGSIVAAGSVVTRSVPPNTIVAGNPAKPLRPRFDVPAFDRHRRLLDMAGHRTLPPVMLIETPKSDL